MPTFKHITPAFLLTLLSICSERSWADATIVDLLAAGEHTWQPFDGARWQISGGSLRGATRIMDGAITDPAASAFLLSRQKFGGNVTVQLDVSFKEGRYLGIYVDFDEERQSGIWMATGHRLAADAADNEVERAYIKTVDESVWVVRATGELEIEPGQVVRLRISRNGQTYAIRRDDQLIATYRKPDAYPPGRLQLRLTNASAEVHKLIVTADRVY